MTIRFYKTRSIREVVYEFHSSITFSKANLLHYYSVDSDNIETTNSFSERTEQPLLEKRTMPTECLCVGCGQNITDPDFRVVLCQEEYPEIEIGPYCEQCLARIKICSGCQHPFPMDQTTHTGNGEHYCSTCLSSLSLCSHCGKKTPEDLLKEVNGEKVCEGCFKNHFFYCKSCENYHYKSVRVKKNSLEGLRKAGIFRKYGEAVCRTCYDKRSPHYKTYEVFECEHCGRKYSPSGSHTSKRYCQHCYNEFKTCSFCGRKEPCIDTIRVDGTATYTCMSCKRKLNFCSCCDQYTQKEIFIVTGKFHKYTVCENCKNAKECKHCGTLSISSVCNQCKDIYVNNVCSTCGRIKDEHGNCRVCAGSKVYSYSYKPRKFLNSLEKDKTGDIIFGFENEVTYGSKDAAMKKGLKELYESYDPTTLVAKSDSSIMGSGYEIVSQPMTLAFFNKLPLDKMLPSKLSPSTSCGLHVHVGREAFISDVHLYKICNFLLTNVDFTEHVAGRSFNSYCKAFRRKTSEEVIRSKKTRDTERHQAVNLRNEHTVEFRLFAGCTEEKELRGRIEFLHALITYMKVTPISQAREVKPFINFVLSNTKLYPNAGNLVASYELH